MEAALASLRPAPNSIITVIEPTSNSFYLNIVLLNKDEVVEKVVQEKMGRGPFGFGFGAFAASSVAKRAMKDEKVTANLAEKLVEMVPKQVASMGIQLSMTKRFVSGPLVVLRAEIEETDPVKLMLNAKGEDASRAMQQLQDAMSLLELDEAKGQMQSKMMAQARAKLMEKLVETLPVKLSEAAGAKVDMTALDEAGEAEWFFNFMNARS